MATINGTSGNDTLSGGDDDDLLFGFAGADSFNPSGGNDRYDGGAVLDRFRFTDLNSIDYRYLPLGIGIGLEVNLSGISGDGSVGHGIAQTLNHQPGVDQLVNVQGVLGSYYSDRLIGSSALVPEFFDGGGGNDTIDGGAITDPLGRNGNRIDFGRSFEVHVDLQAGTASIQYFSAAASSLTARALAVTAAQTGGPERHPEAIPRTAFNLTLANINDVVATGYADTLLGSNRSDVFEFFAPGAGIDSIDGRGGIDILRYDLAQFASNVGVVASLATGTTSNDGWGTSDSFSGIEGLYGGRFADQLSGAGGAVEYFMGNAGNDTIDGGEGFDWASYSLAPAGVSVTLGGSVAGSASDGEGGTDRLLAIEGVEGSAFDDTLTGSASATLERFAGFAGNDTIDGGAGPDEANYERTAYLRGIVVDLAQQRASEDGNGGHDTLLGIEHVTGSLLYGDWIAGNSGDNVLSGSGGNDTLNGGGGNDTLDGGAGFADVADLSGTAAVRVDLGAGTATRGAGAAQEQLTLIGIEGVFSGDGEDRLIGNDADYNLFVGGAGNDTIDGGPTSEQSLGIDIAIYRSSTPVVADLQAGSATQGGFTDTLIRIDAVMGGSGADMLRGADGAATLRGETLRGGAGDDSIDGGSGVDRAEFTGERAGYDVVRSGAAITVTDTPVGGSIEGIDTLTNIERLIFADQMLAFGTRAEEVARVAFVLWTPGILFSTALFARGLSFYDVGYDFDTLCSVALIFHPGDVGRGLAQKLVSNMPGTTKTVDDIVAIMAQNPGADFGRTAAVKAMALDDATTRAVAESGILTKGLAADLEVPGFGTLFELLPGG